MGSSITAPGRVSLYFKYLLNEKTTETRKITVIRNSTLLDLSLNNFLQLETKLNLDKCMEGLIF